jgi:hypothetical protein
LRLGKISLFDSGVTAFPRFPECEFILLCHYQHLGIYRRYRRIVQCRCKNSLRSLVCLTHVPAWEPIGARAPPEVQVNLNWWKMLSGRMMFESAIALDCLPCDRCKLVDSGEQPTLGLLRSSEDWKRRGCVSATTSSLPSQ